MGSTRLWVEATSLSVFIAAGTWGLVRMSLIGLAGTRYFEMRAERYPESSGWRRPRFLGRIPLLVASIGFVPALVAFVLTWGLAVIPEGAWIALLVAWPVAAAVLLFMDSRSPWTRLRGVLAAAANVKFDQRDAVLAEGFESDPQIAGTTER